MKIRLSDHFDYRKLLRFVLPSVGMMVFTSIYGVVDGFFVSNFVGKTSFAALNFIMPYIMGIGSVGFMFGAGGSALVAKELGEGKTEKANSDFSTIIYVLIGVGAVLSVLGLVFLRPVAVAMGADDAMIEDCVLYGSILLAFQIPFMLQVSFQSFFITAEKPSLGLAATIASGVTNMVLDAVVVGVMGFGLAGAAAATVMSEVVGGGIPLVYFLRRNNSTLRLGKPKLDFRALLKVCANGSSEMLTNISASVVGIVFNLKLMELAGENGVAAHGTLMYVNFVFVAIFIGYSMGCAPIISYNYGARNYDEQKNIFRKSMLLLGLLGFAMTALAELFAPLISQMFVGYDAALYELTVRGFRLYSLAFIIDGYNIFGSSFFTALNNGIVSAVISFLRTLVFQISAVLILPELLGMDGIWLAMVAAELLTVMVTVTFIVKKRKVYNYA